MAATHPFTPPEIITTKRFILRKPRMPDANDIFNNYATDPEVTRHVIWQPHRDVHETDSFVESLLTRWDSGEEYSWGITLPADDRVIGMIGCRVREHAANIGYVLARKHWGQGFTAEAAQAVVDWAFTIESIYRVWAVCDVENKASARVMEKIGMQREGILRRYIVHPNISLEPRDVFVYARVR